VGLSVQPGKLAGSLVILENKTSEKVGKLVSFSKFFMVQNLSFC